MFENGRFGLIWGYCYDSQNTKAEFRLIDTHELTELGRVTLRLRDVPLNTLDTVRLADGRVLITLAFPFAESNNLRIYSIDTAFKSINRVVNPIPVGDVVSACFITSTTRAANSIATMEDIRLVTFHWDDERGAVIREMPSLKPLMSCGFHRDIVADSKKALMIPGILASGLSEDTKSRINDTVGPGFGQRWSVVGAANTSGLFCFALDGTLVHRISPLPCHWLSRECVIVTGAIKLARRLTYISQSHFLSAGTVTFYMWLETAQL
jgi:hypothetical protein